MGQDYSHKSSVEDIRRRFDADVERFSNLESGQSATVDAPLTLDLVTQTAAALLPEARAVLDIGCGAGNYTLKMLQRLANLDVTLNDLSAPMLARAVERIRPNTTGAIEVMQGDIRDLQLGTDRFDIILASQVFHHLRAEDEWRDVFSKCLEALKPGGVLLINDLVAQQVAEVEGVMRQRWGEYLTGLKNEHYKETVFGYVEREDTPRPLFFQLTLLMEVGFRVVDVLHKNVCFAAFYALK